MEPKKLSDRLSVAAQFALTENDGDPWLRSSAPDGIEIEFRDADTVLFGVKQDMTWPIPTCRTDTAA